MNWLMYVIIGIVLIWILSKFSDASKSKRLAKRLLAKYHEYKIKNPEANTMEIYTQVARSMPQYRSQKAFEELLEFAHSLSVKRDGIMEAHVTLMWLILAMCIIESGIKSGDSSVSGAKATRLYGTVYRTIPRDL